MKKRMILFFAALVAAMLVVAGCGAADPPAATPEPAVVEATPEPEATPVPEAELPPDDHEAYGDLIVAIGVMPGALDQTRNDLASALVSQQIYSTLVWLHYDEHGATFVPHPNLATTWHMPDASTVVMTLRDDVFFHDGVQMTAYDVQHSIERATRNPDPRVISGMISHVTVQDDFNFTIHLLFPFVPILNNLGHVIMGIVPRHVPDEVLAEHPIGSGPFMFDYLAIGNYVQFVRNPNYFGEPARVQTLRFNLIPDSDVRVIEVNLGSAHIGNDIMAPHVAVAEASDTATLMRTDNLVMNYIGFNMQPYNNEHMPRPLGEPNPFADWRVRHAINYALDVDAIIDATLFGVGRPLQGFASDVNPDFVPGAAEPFDFNLERALELMEEAGWGPDNRFEANFWYNIGNTVRMQTAEIVQFMLAPIGIDVIVSGLEFTVYLDRCSNFEHCMFTLGWVSVVGDMEYALSIFHSANLGPAGNRFYMRDDEVDRILDAAREETDPARRTELYLEAQRLIRDVAPIALLNQGEIAVHVSDQVAGLILHPGGSHNFSRVFFR